MKLGVICAMPEEIALLAGEQPAARVHDIPLLCSSAGETQLVLALSGIGKANAAACAQLLIDRYAVDALLNIGMAGAACDLPLGGAVVVQQAVYHDMDMGNAVQGTSLRAPFVTDAALSETAAEVLSRLGIPHQSGLLATGDQFVDNREQKADIKRRTGCSCIEMEGGAIAHIANKCGVPCCLVKVMSDRADETAAADFRATLGVDRYVRISTDFIAAFAAALPR